MSGDEPPEESALRQLPEHEAASVEVDDGLLLAYHAGRLEPAEAARIEALLAESREARALLLELTRPPDGALLARLEAVSGLRPRRFIAWAAGSASIAASILLFVFQTPNAPKYTLEVEGFVAVERGREPAESGRLDEASRLILRLRPEVEVESPPPIQILMGPEGGPLGPPSAGQLESAKGAFRWSADARALFSAPGRYRIVVTVGEGDVSTFVVDVEYHVRGP